MRINGIELKGYSPTQRRILVALGLQMPGRLTTRELVEIVHPDPDLEPDYAAASISTIASKLKFRLPKGWTIIGRSWGGYRLECLEVGK